MAGQWRWQKSEQVASSQQTGTTGWACYEKAISEARRWSSKMPKCGTLHSSNEVRFCRNKDCRAPLPPSSPSTTAQSGDTRPHVQHEEAGKEDALPKLDIPAAPKPLQKVQAVFSLPTANEVKEEEQKNKSISLKKEQVASYKNCLATLTESDPLYVEIQAKIKKIEKEIDDANPDAARGTIL